MDFNRRKVFVNYFLISTQNISHTRTHVEDDDDDDVDDDDGDDEEHETDEEEEEEKACTGTLSAHRKIHTQRAKHSKAQGNNRLKGLLHMYRI